LELWPTVNNTIGGALEKKRIDVKEKKKNPGGPGKRR